MLPEGLSSAPSTRSSNLISNRASLLVRMAICLGQIPLVEQPDHKRGLVAMRRWQQLLEDFVFYRQYCKQGAYKAETPKPTALYSTHCRWGNLLNELGDGDCLSKKPLVSKKRDILGKEKLTGMQEPLRTTQHYTSAFGAAIAEHWQQPCAAWIHGACGCHDNDFDYAIT